MFPDWLGSNDARQEQPHSDRNCAKGGFGFRRRETNGLLTSIGSSGGNPDRPNPR